MKDDKPLPLRSDPNAPDLYIPRTCWLHKARYAGVYHLMGLGHVRREPITILSALLLSWLVF